MRVMVTGAQGCIGAWVVKRLIDRGVDIMVYDRDLNPARLSMIASKEEIDKVVFEQGQIEDADRIKTLVKDGGITHIIHLAAVLMPYCQANPISGGMINVMGTLNVFEAARDAGREVRVSYASSSAVWGPEEAYEKRALNENDPLHPATHYGVFKQANEGNARVFYTANGISSVGLRPWTVYGVGRDGGLTAGPSLAMRAIANGQPFTIGVTGFMDLQYVEDVAEMFIRGAIADLPGAHVFNLAGEIVSMEQLIELLDKIRPGAAKLISAAGNQVPVAFRMDATAIHEKLPGLPQTPLEEGARKSIEIFEKLRG